MLRDFERQKSAHEEEDERITKLMCACVRVRLRVSAFEHIFVFVHVGYM